MGVAQDGVHYVSTVTRVQTLHSPVTAAAMATAIEVARAEWSRTNRDDREAAEVRLEPGPGVLYVMVDLDVTRHDVRPSLHATRGVTAQRAVDAADAPPPR